MAMGKNVEEKFGFWGFLVLPDYPLQRDSEMLVSPASSASILIAGARGE
jgi:hypothetical protein